jgi:esterase/lipase
MFFTKEWKYFSLIEITSSYDTKIQKAYFYKTKSNYTMPLVISLHTWAGDYKQHDPLAELVKNEDWNYIHPDFRGPNDSSDACMIEAVIQDIDDAITYSIKNGNVDQSNIIIVGLSGGGMATLGVFMKSSYNLKYCMAWAPISDLEAWYYQSKYMGNKYWKDILKATSYNNHLNVEEAKKRSPLYMHIEKSKAMSSLEIYAGIHDGYAGSVSILHSILFYNKMSKYFCLYDGIVSDKEIMMLLSRSINPQICEELDKRKLIYKKSYSNLGLFIFDGTHEILPLYAIARIKDKING